MVGSRFIASGGIAVALASVLLSLAVPVGAAEAPPAAPAEAGVRQAPAQEEPVVRLTAAELKALLAAKEPATSVDAASETADAEIIDLMQLFLTVLAIVFTALGVIGALLGYAGFRSLRDLRETRKNMGETSERFAADADALAEMKEYFEDLQEGVDSSVTKILRYFAELPESELRGVVGVKPKPQDPRKRRRFEDDDRVLQVLHSLGLLHNLKALTDRDEEIARAFLKLGRYWRSRLDFGRSVLRIELAAELASEELKPLMKAQAGVTLAQWGAWRRKLPDEVPGPPAEELLRQAREALRVGLESPSLQRIDLNLMLGGVEDELENFDRAMKLYREGLELPEEPAPGEESLLLADHDTLRYNLACTLCRAERYEESLDELEQLVGHGSQIRDAADDPELAPLRGDPRWSDRWEELVRRDREQR